MISGFRGGKGEFESHGKNGSASTEMRDLDLGPAAFAQSQNYPQWPFLLRNHVRELGAHLERMAAPGEMPDSRE
jgi:hypothetical protein